MGLTKSHAAEKKKKLTQAMSLMVLAGCFCAVTDIGEIGCFVIGIGETPRKTDPPKQTHLKKIYSRISHIYLKIYKFNYVS